MPEVPLSLPATPLEHPEGFRIDGRRLRPLSLAIVAAAAGYPVCRLVGPAAAVSGLVLHNGGWAVGLLGIIIGGTAGPLRVPGVRAVEPGPEAIVVESLSGSTRIPWGGLVRARADRALREIVLVPTVRDRRGRPRVRSIVVTESQAGRSPPAYRRPGPRRGALRHRLRRALAGASGGDGIAPGRPGRCGRHLRHSRSRGDHGRDRARCDRSARGAGPDGERARRARPDPWRSGWTVACRAPAEGAARTVRCPSSSRAGSRSTRAP